MHGVSDVWQIGIFRAELLVPDPSPFEVETAIAKLLKYKSPGSDQIPAELIQAGGRTLLSAIHKLIYSIWNKEEFPDRFKESIVVPFQNKTGCNNYHRISLLSTSYKLLSDILLSMLVILVYIRN
jgi:hypothetical protein